MTYEFPRDEVRQEMTEKLRWYAGANFSDKTMASMVDDLLKVVNKEFVRKVEVLHEAVRFYADPDTYFACSFGAEAPYGAFVDDFTEVTSLPTEKPGKLARETLREFWERDTVPWQDEAWGDEWGRESDDEETDSDSGDGTGADS